MLSFLKKAFSNQNSGEAMAAAAKFVQQEIRANKVIVFSKSYCPYCTTAKQALNSELGRGKYKVIELERRPDCSAIQEYLSQITGSRTVPRVFIDGNCIGGGSETAQMQRSGQLQKLLRQHGLMAA